MTASSTSESRPVSLLIVNARVRTGDPRRPWADAVSVREGRVDALGRSAELRKRLPHAVIVDAHGMTVLPGTAGGAIIRGALADLVLIESPPNELEAPTVDHTTIVLQLVRGCVTVDRTAAIGFRPD
jgi:hypothetical protein